MCVGGNRQEWVFAVLCKVHDSDAVADKMTHDWNDAHCGAFVCTSLCLCSVSWGDTTFAKWHHFLTPLLPGGITFWHLFCQKALLSNTTFARQQHFLTTLLPDSITFWQHACQMASLPSITYVYLYVVLHHYLGTTPPPPPPLCTLRFCKTVCHHLWSSLPFRPWHSRTRTCSGSRRWRCRLMWAARWWRWPRGWGATSATRTGCRCCAAGTTTRRRRTGTGLPVGTWVQRAKCELKVVRCSLSPSLLHLLSHTCVIM